MIKAIPHSQSCSDRPLLEIWACRYKVDTLKIIQQCTGEKLSHALSKDGLQQTAAIVQKWSQTSCEFGGLNTNSLFSYIPNVVSLEDVRQIAKVVKQIYAKLLNSYQQQKLSPTWVTLVDALNTSKSQAYQLDQAYAIDLPTIHAMAYDIEPLISTLRETHLNCYDQRTIGFMSTQFHFSNHLLLSQLQPAEQALLSPYLQFAEEQVCIPWKQICTAASLHPAGSPILKVATSMLAQSSDIANDIHSQAVTRFPNHRSRRSLITQPDVTASFMRDLSMFQAYLWLCVLEGNLSAIKDELLPLCVMVFPAISVDWEMTTAVIELMTDCIQQHMDARYINLVQPYMEAMQQLFLECKPA